MRRSFKTRVFINILLLVLAACFSLSLLFARNQTGLLEKDLVEDGTNTAKVLASNLRLGLLTGGDEFLTEPLQGIMEQNDVLQVAVYGEKGNLVMLKEKISPQAIEPPYKVIALLGKDSKPVVLNGSNHFEFWVPVSYSRSPGKFENGFFPRPSTDKKTIGFVRLSLSKDKIIKGRKYVMTWAVLVIVLCIFLGSTVSYYTASRVTGPLRSLVSEIRSMGQDGIKRLSPDGDDEIIELAEAFNTMADSLDKRESARKKAERVLQEAEERLRTVINNAPIVLYAVDAAGVFTVLEGKGLEGSLMPGEVVGRSALDLYGSLTVEEGGAVIPISDVLKRVLSGETVYFVSMLSGICFENRLVPFSDMYGNIKGAIGIALDITERKRSEERLQAYQEELRSLASEMSLIEERERRTIATDLHDHIGQVLAMSKIKLGELRELSGTTPIAKQAVEIQGLIEQAISYTRSLTFELSPPILYELGFEAAVEWLTEQFREKHGLTIDFENDGPVNNLDTESAILIFKAVRELLFNIIKHAHASRVKVIISASGGTIMVTVEDDGIGFIYPSPKAGQKGGTKSFGLFSIREQLQHAGGQLHVRSIPGQGTTVTLEVPLKSGGVKAVQVLH
jgi:PAS domain S-box-containing protein